MAVWRVGAGGCPAYARAGVRHLIGDAGEGKGQPRQVPEERLKGGPAAARHLLAADLKIPRAGARGVHRARARTTCSTQYI